MVCVVCGPSLFNTRLPQPAREAQLLHEALTSQLTSACPFCQETTVGIVTQCQNDRSQHKNKDQAMKQMKAKLYELEMQKKNAEKQAMEDNKSDIGWGSQIRSYVLDDSRIKDLRTGVETRNTQAVLDGSLDQFIEASLKAGL